MIKRNEQEKIETRNPAINLKRKHRRKRRKEKKIHKRIKVFGKSEKITLIDANMFQDIEQKDDSFNHDSSRENDDSDIEPGK